MIKSSRQQQWNWFYIRDRTMRCSTQQFIWVSGFTTGGGCHTELIKISFKSLVGKTENVYSIQNFMRVYKTWFTN